VQPSVTE